MTHELKTWTEYYQQVKIGRKTFEVRANDKNFQIGDTLILKEWLPQLKEFTGDIMQVQVMYILHGGQFGIEKGFVVMSIQ